MGSLKSKLDEAEREEAKLKGEVERLKEEISKLTKENDGGENGWYQGMSQQGEEQEGLSVHI